MLVDIINEQSKTHAVSLIIVNSVINSELLSNVSSEVKIAKFNRNPGNKSILDIAKLNMHFVKNKPDVIHCHGWNLARLLLFSRWRKTLTVHNTFQKPDQQCLIKYDRIFAISKAVAKDITKKCKGITPVVVYNGIDFTQIDSRKDYRYDTFEMVQVGGLNCKLKAQDILLKALHCVVYQYEIQNVHLDFIGSGASYDYLKAITKELKLDSYCSFLGQCPRKFINSNLKKYNLLIQPSNLEGFGLVIVEGMAAKIPVLVSNVEGPWEIIQHGKFGYSFEVGNPKDCAKKIIETMSEYEKPGFKQYIDNVYLTFRTYETGLLAIYAVRKWR
jgi:glycosyltransferase involved in cell wall biosynthesis